MFYCFAIAQISILCRVRHEICAGRNAKEKITCSKVLASSKVVSHLGTSNVPLVGNGPSRMILCLVFVACLGESKRLFSLKWEKYLLYLALFHIGSSAQNAKYSKERSFQDLYRKVTTFHKFRPGYDSLPSVELRNFTMFDTKRVVCILPRIISGGCEYRSRQTREMNNQRFAFCNRGTNSNINHVFKNCECKNSWRIEVRDVTYISLVIRTASSSGFAHRRFHTDTTKKRQSLTEILSNVSNRDILDSGLMQVRNFSL